MAALTKKDEDAIAEHLHEYRDILTEHIQREDEVLYPWMDRKISAAHSDRVLSWFSEELIPVYSVIKNAYYFGDLRIRLIK